MSARRYHKWTVSEVEYLKHAWADKSNEEIALDLNLPKRACETKASALHLRKSTNFLATNRGRFKPGHKTAPKPNGRPAWNKGLKGGRHSEATKAKISDTLRALWRKEDFRTTTGAAIIRSTQARWQDEQYRTHVSARVSDGLKRSWANPSAKRLADEQKKATRAKAQWSDYDFRQSGGASILVALKTAQADPAWRQRMRDKASSEWRKRWADSSVAKRLREAITATLKSKWEDDSFYRQALRRLKAGQIGVDETTCEPMLDLLVECSVTRNILRKFHNDISTLKDLDSSLTWKGHKA